MKYMVLVCSLLLFAFSAAAQQSTQEPAPVPLQEPAPKACLAFSSDNSATSHFSRDALQSAATQSGDFDFSPTERGGCWTVHEISAPVTGTQSYTISWVVVDPRNAYVGHGLNMGKQDEFTNAMRSAETTAAKDMHAQMSH